MFTGDGFSLLRISIYLYILNKTGGFHSPSFFSGPPGRGIPGVPGAADLEAALKRLTPAEVLARRANLQHGPTYGG